MGVDGRGEQGGGWGWGGRGRGTRLDYSVIGLPRVASEGKKNQRRDTQTQSIRLEAQERGDSEALAILECGGYCSDGSKSIEPTSSNSESSFGLTCMAIERRCPTADCPAASSRTRGRVVAGSRHTPNQAANRYVEGVRKTQDCKTLCYHVCVCSVASDGTGFNDTR